MAIEHENNGHDADNIDKLYELVNSNNVAQAELRQKVYSLADAVESYMKTSKEEMDAIRMTQMKISDNISDSRKANWPVYLSAASVLLTVVVIFGGFLQYNASIIQKYLAEGINRNETAINKLIEADHINQRNIAAMDKSIAATERDTGRLLRDVREEQLTAQRIREFSVEGHARQDEKIKNIEETWKVLLNKGVGL